ncbi:TPA: transcription termination/antitermination NusG family protein [Escherichia coli]
MYKWYVLYCNSQDIQRISRRAEELGVEIFCPRYIKVTPRTDCRAVRQEEKPLFPSYLFLRFDVNVVHTSTITSIPGAHGFVSFGAAPCTVSESVITAIECARLLALKEGANKQVISSQADSLIKISRIWADFFPANTSNQPI